jgi:hypothetical protein
LVALEQGPNFTRQLVVVSTGPRDKGGPLSFGKVECVEKYRLDASPLLVPQVSWFV